MLFAPLQHIANAEVLADLPHVYGLALVGEGGAARDHERAADPREARSQPLGQDIGKVILPRIAAQIGKGEYNNGKSSALLPTPSGTASARLRAKPAYPRR